MTLREDATGSWPAPPAPTLRFADRASDYAHSRPRYPQQLIDVLVEICALAPTTVIADIGSGTGLSAEPFLRFGCTVHGVEPNAEMRAAAERQLADRPGFRSVAGTAEQTGLTTGSIDLIVVAQAFHWFDAPRARTEFVRVLRPGGRVALLWNRRRVDDTAFHRAYERLLQEYGTDYDAVRQRTARVTGGAAAELSRFFRGGFVRRVFDNAQDLDAAGLAARVRSSSYMPAQGHPRHEAMLDAVARLFERHAVGGTVRIQYDLELYAGHVG